jgi:hypothetical protein
MTRPPGRSSKLEITAMSEHGIPLGSRGSRSSEDARRRRAGAAVVARKHPPHSRRTQPQEKTQVASIIVVADSDAGDATGFLFKERVSVPLLDDPHFSSRLIERMGWALADAEQAERARDRSTR